MRPGLEVGIVAVLIVVAVADDAVVDTEFQWVTVKFTFIGLVTNRELLKDELAGEEPCSVSVDT